MSNHERYPLSWPEGWKRTAPSLRRRALFGKSSTYRSQTGEEMYGGKKSLSLFDSATRVLHELKAMGVSEDDILLSTNVRTRMDGLPRSNESEPRDPGAAVYWKRKSGRPECMAIDQYNRVADNVAAIAATLEAMRAIERHGGAEILSRAFQGFAALPERASGKSWYDVLQFDPREKVTVAEVKARFIAIAKKRHPDAGGSEEGFRELIWARDQALSDLKGHDATQNDTPRSKAQYPGAHTSTFVP